MKIRIIITEKYPVYEASTENVDGYLAEGTLCQVPDDQLQRWKNVMYQFEEMQKEMAFIHATADKMRVQKSTDRIGLIG